MTQSGIEPTWLNLPQATSEVACGFTDWHTLPINLPYLALCDEGTARGMERLAERALRTPFLEIVADAA